MSGATHQPFVSVVTPVYNGEEFLRYCIESVLAQDYGYWEYVIVNNCSTDATPHIAQSYADRDPRIRVVTNETFVNCEENHNIAFRQISPRSKYCKVVSADDRLLPECLSKMVDLAERCPTAGIVGSYQLSGDEIRWKGIPTGVELISGRNVCRSSLLGKLDVFGNPSSCLYRSDLVRKHFAMFPHSLPHADTSACYKHLNGCDFGFVHKILSVEGVHDRRDSTRVERLGMGNVAYLDDCLTYGPVYLNHDEFVSRRDELLEGYYEWIGGCIWKLKGTEFWTFHRSRLREMGFPLQPMRIAKCALKEILRELRHPKPALKKLGMILKNRFGFTFERQTT